MISRVVFRELLSITVVLDASGLDECCLGPPRDCQKTSRFRVCAIKICLRDYQDKR